MPIAEVTGEWLGGLFRLLGNFFIEKVLEVLVKGLGYSVCRIFSKSVDQDGFVVAIVGVFAWIVIGVLIYFGYEYFSTQAAIDSCLDSGGRFNYDQQICERQNA
ncbi:hypothetical protein NCG89_14655 [Spongiibacter taiwanensis]|uniref:hypothetical protein n=1 Tax=Spongiibacter taiwanensis TaxID=1748242 RepID=UPI002035D27E|nr:hypothetical protein [Spongiibacter taiwanensis]USA42771.1 hypothetical protein NCG89_14655 [Spongiibacter taiwanensis]